MTNERKVDGESRGRLLDDIADIAHQHERKLAFEKLVAEAAAAERRRIVALLMHLVEAERWNDVAWELDKLEEAK